MGNWGMKNDLDILRELIRDDARAPVKNNNGKATITLEESGRGRQDYSINIVGAPSKTIAIALDKNFPAPEKIFNGGKGECKRADFVLITITENKKWIIYIEMKKSRPDDWKKVEGQLKGAQCFIAYCRSIGREFWDSQNFLENRNYKERFVGITNISVNKQRIGQRRPRLHDRPSDMLRISGVSRRGLQFNKLTDQ